ncbi:MAG: hypothetical protein QOH06_3802 [Acidobacteriota bacterium]|jgi:hypothetical protein|nr:hypothetical protein [Acidobacteriota bacterium]
MAHVTFVHGIANKPPQEQLIDLWCRSLSNSDGIDLGSEGVTCSMVYWADVMYESPLAEGDQESATNEATSENVSGEPVDLEMDEMDAEEKIWMAELATKLAIPLAIEEAVEAAPTPVKDTLERIPLPWPIKARIMKRLLRDVHHYLFNVKYSPRPGDSYQVQDVIRGRMIEALKAGAAKPGPHIVVSHSMGTVIAYDCLKRVADAPMVDGLITIGSPLGIDEIQDKLKPEWSRDNGFPHEKVRGPWINIYDTLDPVAGFDPKFSNDYRKGGEKVVEDINEQNHGTWRHDISKYMSGAQMRGKLRGLLGLE